MSVNPWDEFPAPAGNFVEFNNVGDECGGVIKSIGVQVWDDGKKSPQIIFAPDGGGEDQTLTVSWVMLLSAFKKEAPGVGDHFRCKWTAVGPKPKETREWSLVVTPGNGAAPAAAPAGTASTTVPSSAAAAETPAGITPEQLAAMQAMSDPAPAWDSDPRVAQLRGMGIADEAIRSTLNL